jgi:hypothetical protein
MIPKNIDLGDYYYNPSDLLGKGNFGEVYQGISKKDN